MKENSTLFISVVVYLGFTKLFVYDFLVLKVVFFLETFVLISNRHQVTLDNSGNFSVFIVFWVIRGVRSMCAISIGGYKHHTCWHHLAVYFLLVSYYNLTIITLMERIFIRGSASVTLTIPRITSITIV